MNNQDYKREALNALKGNWAPAVLATIVFVLIVGIFSAAQELLPRVTEKEWTVLILYPLMMLVLAPIEVGYFNAILKYMNEGDNAVTSNTFRISFGKDKWSHTFLCVLAMSLICMLGSLLLIIPGIILSFAYAMVPFIIVKHPELSVKETLRASRKMMKGHKFDYFCLILSFIGWLFLAIISFGIGAFWVTPYMTAATGAFWNDIYSRSELAAGNKEQL